MEIDEIRSLIDKHPGELIRLKYKTGEDRLFTVSEINDSYFYGHPVNSSDLTQHQETPLFRIDPSWLTGIESSGILETDLTLVQDPDDS